MRFRLSRQNTHNGPTKGVAVFNRHELKELHNAIGRALNTEEFQLSAAREPSSLREMHLYISPVYDRHGDTLDNEETT